MVALVVSKLFLFYYMKQSSWRPRHLLYFNVRNMVLSRSYNSFYKKHLLNQVNRIIAMIAVWYVVIKMLAIVLDFNY